jgi:DNA topoisomerase IB
MHRREHREELGRLRFASIGADAVSSNQALLDRCRPTIRCHEDLPGQELLQYVDEAGNFQDVRSTDVNDYLKEINRREGLSHLGGHGPRGYGPQ